MTIDTTPPPAHRPSRRQGTTLVVTMVVIAAVASILAISTEQMLGMHKLSGSHLVTQTNAYTAEACAGMIEGYLFNAANNDPALIQDIAPSTATIAAATPGTYNTAQMAATWNNWAGYTGPFRSNLAAGSSWPTMWLGNCMVTWRIEPLTIYDQTFSSPLDPVTGLPSSTPTAGKNTINYNALLPTTGSSGSTVNNPGYFQYRLVVTSYYIDLTVMANKYGQNMATATPWASPGEALSVIECQRQIQLRLLNLFQYVIFYAAVGPAGDIEFHPGGSLTITGAVHSNGAIYFGGTSLSGTNYHAATCQGGQITVGTAAAPVGIDAPGGIFRQQKDANVLLAINTPAAAAVLDPNQVPQRNGVIGGVTMSGNNDLNGDDDTNTKVMLNGYPLVSNNDTRSGLKVTNGQVSKYLRDNSNGSGVVSLSNFPNLKGYAFEPQAFVPSADNGITTPLYWKGLAPGGTTQAWNQYEFTINNSIYPNAQALYYTGPGGNITATPSAYPVYATDMPLWTMQFPNQPAGTTYQDVWPTGKWIPGYYNYMAGPGGWMGVVGTGFIAPGAGTLTQLYLPKISINKGPLGVPSTLDTYLPEVPAAPHTTFYSGQPAEGHYFSNTLHGATGTTTTGITIRERGAPNLLFTFDLVEHPPIGVLPQQGHLIMSDTPPFWCVPDCSTASGTPAASAGQLQGAEWMNAYAAMMMSKYVVYLGKDVNGDPFDITVPFFRFGLGLGGANATCHTWNGLIGSAVPQLYFGLGALDGSAAALALSGWQQQITPTPTGMIATSDLFCNPREGSWLEVNRYLNAASTPTPATYQVDALTLNIGQICSFLSSTIWSTVTTGAQQTSIASAGTALSSLFSGVIYTHRTHRTLTPIAYAAVAPAGYYPGCPWSGCMPASDVASYGQNPPPPPPTPTSYGATYSPQGAAGVPNNRLSYPNLNGYKTFFLPPWLGPEQDQTVPAVCDHSLPIYDPLEPLGYSPLITWNTTQFSITPELLVTTMNLGTNSNCLYPVIGTTTPTNGGVVGLGTTQARVGMPYVWSVYPSPLAVRLYNGVAINWGGVQPAANNRPQGLTVITPNTCYIQGNYNTTQFPDASGTAKTTPCAVFCDGLTTLSNAWSDLPGATATYTGGVKNASPTAYIVSVMINNQPTDYENTIEEGSDGTHNVIRYAENWGAGGIPSGASTWTFQGSLVVLNRTRYGRSYVPGAPPTSSISPFNIFSTTYAANTAGSFYGVPSRIYQFNSDLLTQAGNPPDAPHAITVQRVVSTINISNH